MIGFKILPLVYLVVNAVPESFIVAICLKQKCRV